MTSPYPVLHEPARTTPVVHEADFCVAGGSCTGVFAAVRAARLGLSVVLIEQNTLLGGMAVAAQVNEWHSLYDVSKERIIIAGLTREIVERLRQRKALHEVPREEIHRAQFRFNSAELAVELDELVRAHRIRVYLGARCVAACRDQDGRLEGGVIEDKSGRRAIRARVFLDATGDGDLLRQAGFSAEKPAALQPVNLQAIVNGLDELKSIYKWPDILPLAETYSYPTSNSSPWLCAYPGAPELRNVYGPRLNDIDASEADQLTEAYFESRRLHRAFLDMVAERYADAAPALSIVSWAHWLGVRETWHASCRHRLTGSEILQGVRFPDAIANGTYPVDIHSREGTVLRYLDGREEIVAPGGGATWRRWRDENAPAPPCYHIPYRSLVPVGSTNLLVAGRLLDADREAFGGVRVMVNMNQTGEAAGVAAALSLRENVSVADLNPNILRRTLSEGGSLIL